MRNTSVTAALQNLKASSRVEITLKANDTLFRLGDEPIGIYRVETGEVRLSRHTKRGEVLVLHRARNGELLAEASLFSKTCHCDAIAERDSVVTRYDKQAVLSELAADPSTAIEMMTYMAREIQNLRKRLEIVSTRSATERVLLHLRHLSDEQQSVAPGFVIRKLADDIALTPEAYSRALKNLLDDGKIERTADGGIDILR